MTPHDDDSLQRYLRELATIHPLTKEEESELLLHVQAHDQQEELASKRLIEANLTLVASIAEQYSGSELPVLEIIQEGNLGLFTGVNTFADNRGAFKDHAVRRIRDAISEAITKVNDLKNRRAKIEAVIRKESEDFFNDEDLRVLRIVIRITCEFSDFLHTFKESPDLYEASYMAGTIRAGLDEFVDASAWGRILTDSRWGKDDTWNPPSSFSEMKASYNSTFQQLLECTSSVKGVEMLLALSQIMLFFMAAYFPFL